MEIMHKIKMDLAKLSITPRIPVVQGDTHTRRLSIALYSDRRPWQIPSEASVVIRYRKPDRTSGTYDTLSDGSSAVNIRGNTIDLCVAPEAVSLAGTATLMVTFFLGQQRLSTFSIDLLVAPDCVSGWSDEEGAAWIAAFLPSPENAEPGQHFVVDQVDDAGHVLSVRTMDLTQWLENYLAQNGVEQSVSICHAWDGTILTVSSASGTSSADLKGEAGESAYEIAIANGFAGTEAQWLESLKGEKGDTGASGADGKSAYQYAQDGGYTGTEEEFAEKLAQELPETLPNPNALTINGKVYDGSESVDITIVGGSAGENTLLGQTPFTTTEALTVKLVGEGEHTYSVKGKTIADLSTVTISQSNAEITEHENYIEISDTGASEWYNSYVRLSVSGLTIGTTYIFAIIGLGIDTTNLINNGYYLIKNANGTELGRISQDSAALHSVQFTPDTSDITISCYPASNYYWNSSNHRTARIGDLYINEASNGTERTDVVNTSGTFTNSYTLGRVSKGITIATDPSCEVYSVSGGDSESSATLPLAGKKIVCFGDSLFGMYTGNTSAPAFVAEHTGATVYNVGFSGCRMSVHPYTGYNEFCMYALATAITSGDWSAQDAAASSGSANFPDQLAILKEIDFADVDYIVIHYGTNDFTAGNGVAIDNAADPDDYTTLCGALRYSIETLLAAYPGLRIFVSVPAFRYWTADNGTIIYPEDYTNINGNTLPEFVDAIAQTAKEYNLPVIDSYYGLGINKVNAATFLADGVHHNITGRERFGDFIGSCLVAPSGCWGDAKATGGGVDVTAAVGQTIRVKEVDENAKPTAWEAVDYQPRTHWVEEAVVLPETTLAVEDMIAFIEHDDIYVAGKEYKVVFNGEEYLCTAADLEGTAAIGNIDMLLETADNGMPFASLWEDGLGFVVFDGSTSITVSITEVHYMPIPVGYVTNALPYYIDVTGSGTTDDPYVCNDTVENVQAIFNSGRLLAVKRHTAGVAQILPLLMYARPSVEGIYAYGAVLEFYVRYTTADICIVLVPQADGTYAVSTTISE